MTVREIRGHLEELYGIEVSPDLISAVTDAVLAAQLGTGDSVLRVPRRRAAIIYTTNAIEALNSKLRRAIRTRGHFPSDDAVAKLLYLVLNHAAAEWKRPPREWAQAKTQFVVMYNERFVRA